MQKIILSLIILALIALSCSSIPKNYKPPEYKKLGIIAIFPATETFDRDMGIGDVLSDILESLNEENRSWDVTSDLARISMRCGYEVYLLAPDSYFEERKQKIDVTTQRRYDGFIPFNYMDYVHKMKSLVGEYTRPKAYLTGYQDSKDEKVFHLEMRRWDNDKLIFSMDYDYFMRHYNEFFCGADVEGR